MVASKHDDWVPGATLTDRTVLSASYDRDVLSGAKFDTKDFDKTSVAGSPENVPKAVESPAEPDVSKSDVELKGLISSKVIEARSLTQPVEEELENVDDQLEEVEDEGENVDALLESFDNNEVLLSEVPKSYDVTGSIVKRESPDGKKLSIIGTNKKERGSKDVVEDAVVMNLENGIFALGDSHEVKGVPGSGVEAAKDFTKLFSEFKGVSKETVTSGSEDQIREEFARALEPLSENFAANKKEITCSVVQMHENMDGTRTAVIYNVGDSMIVKANKMTGSVDSVGRFDQAGEDLFEMFVHTTDNDALWSMDHPMINQLKEDGADKLASYFRSKGYQDSFDYFKCAEIIARDSSLSDIEKKNYRDSLNTVNAGMSKAFEKKNVVSDRVEVLHLQPGEMLVMCSDGIIDNVDLLRSPEFANAVKSGSKGIEIFLDSAMANARKKDDFSINVIE